MNQNKLNEVHLTGFLVNILNHLGWKGETEIHTIMSLSFVKYYLQKCSKGSLLKRISYIINYKENIIIFI